MALYAVADSDAALDVVQDSMLDFVRSYANRPSEEWPPLYYKVLNSRICDAHRRSSIRNRIFGWFKQDESDESDPLQEVPDPDGTTPLSLLEREKLGIALQEAVKSLPLRQQQAFLLRAWEGFDTASAAIAMNCSQGSVKTHYFRAIQNLKEKLRDFDE